MLSFIFKAYVIVSHRDDEEIDNFITRVKEDAHYAECDNLPLTDVISLIVCSRCRIPALITRSGMQKDISLDTITLDAHLYQRTQKTIKDQNEQRPTPETSVNSVSGGGGWKKGRGGERAREEGDIVVRDEGVREQV